MQHSQNNTVTSESYLSGINPGSTPNPSTLLHHLQERIFTHCLWWKDIPGQPSWDGPSIKTTVEENASSPSTSVLSRWNIPRLPQGVLTRMGPLLKWYGMFVKLFVKVLQIPKGQIFTWDYCCKYPERKKAVICGFPPLDKEKLQTGFYDITTVIVIDGQTESSTKKKVMFANRILHQFSSDP